MNKRITGRRYILLSLLLVVNLQFMPIPEALISWRPMLPFIIVVYWAYIVPSYFGAILGFVYGLTVEAVLGMATLQLALPCAFAVLVVQNVFMKLRSYSVFQQSFYIATLVLLASLLVFPLSQLSLSLAMLGPLSRSFVATVIIWCVLVVWLEPLSRRYVVAQDS